MNITDLERRATDLYFEGRISRNEANIAHLQGGFAELKDKIEALEHKVDTGFAEIMRKLDRNANQLVGAGKLAKFLWLAVPAICSAFAWLAGRHST